MVSLHTPRGAFEERVCEIHQGINRGRTLLLFCWRGLVDIGLRSEVPPVYVRVSYVY